MMTMDESGNLRESTEEELAGHPVLPPSQLPSLTRRQLLLGLLSIEITEADVDTQVALLPASEVEVAKITWKYASEYHRDDPLVSDLAAAFALPSDQVDALWIWASGL